MMKLKQMLEILDYLSEKNWTSLAALMNLTAISRRSLIRRLNEIKEAFDPFEIIESGRQGYRLVENQFYRTYRSFYEMDYKAAALANPLGGITRGDIPGLKDKIDYMSGRIEMKGAAAPAVLRQLVDSLINGTMLRVTYLSKNGPKEHKCAAVKLFLENFLLYAVMFDEANGFMILMGVNKILYAAPSIGRLDKKEQDALLRYVNSAWGKMVRHEDGLISRAEFTISDDLLPYFEQNPLHSSQTIRKTAEANIISLDIHNPLEFSRYIMRLGRHARVLGDADVLSSMRENILGLYEMYIGEGKTAAE